MQCTQRIVFVFQAKDILVKTESKFSGLLRGADFQFALDAINNARTTLVKARATKLEMMLCKALKKDSTDKKKKETVLKYTESFVEETKAIGVPTSWTAVVETNLKQMCEAIVKAT